MNNEIKTIKTILFASLIAAMILPFNGMNFVEAKQIDNEATINAQKIEQFKQKALKDGDIPTSEFLDRVGDKWLSKYDSVEHFEQSEKSIKKFIARNLVSDEWNKANAKDHLKIHNFETITETVGSGHEITLLIAEYQKFQGTFDASEPVQKYHEWIAAQYTVPETEEGITNRLIEILDDEKYLDLANQYAESFNDLANHGSVPNELIQTDVPYWIFIANVSVCESNPECDVEALKSGQSGASAEEIERISSINTPISTGFWEYILPEAHAWTKSYVSYDLYAYLNVTGCYYGNCIEEWHDYSNYNSAAIDVMNYDTPPEHAIRDEIMYFYGSACDNYGGSETVINDVKVTPYLGNSLRTEYAVSNTDYNSCASASKPLTASADWILGIKVESIDGSYYWVP